MTAEICDALNFSNWQVYELSLSCDVWQLMRLATAGCSAIKWAVLHVIRQQINQR